MSQNMYPWPDDGKVRVVVFEGHRLMEAGEPDIPDMTIEIEGGVKDVTSYLSVHCNEVSGSVNAGNNVTCDQVSGSVNAGNSVTCDEIAGSVKAGGSVQCDSIGGNATAGSNITCDEIRGSVTAAVVNVR